MVLFLKNLLFTLVVPASVGIYIPLLLTRGESPSSSFVLPFSFLLFTIGSAFYLWSVWNFATHGRGTPLPLDAPKHLVVQGPYRYTRNPMYFGLFSALLGWLLLFPTAALLIYSLVVAAAVSLFVVLYEEPALLKIFGAEYEEYLSRVPRWIPSFARRQKS